MISAFATGTTITTATLLAMDWKEVDKEPPDVFMIKVALVQISTCWCHVSVTQQLADDEGIVCFLMDQ